jgi:nicotinamide mononucleotide transporter
MTECINNNSIEATGAILAFIYLILEIKRKWFFWVVGIISSAFYVYIFFNARLYAEMGLNFYYILMCFYGLYCWKFSSSSGDENSGFRRIDLKTTFTLSLVFVVLFSITVFLLYYLTDSHVAIPDALIAILSIIATWLAAKKIVECWYIWIFVNIFATGLFLHQKLYPTVILFTVYSILSFVGLIEWQKSVQKNDPTVTKL